MSPLVGRVSDRRGRLVPIRAGLLGAAAVLAVLSLPGSAVVLGALIVLTSAALGAFWAPAMAMLSDAADHARLQQGLAFALVNLAWALGQVAGSGFGGAAADVAGDAVPLLFAATLCLGTFAWLVVRQGGERPVLVS